MLTLLSDAIRLGSMLRPQVFGRLFRDGGSCAIGAAIEACGWSVSEHGQVMPLDGAITTLRSTFPVSNKQTPCPACLSRLDNVVNCLAHLNDRHCWSRERIADWVQTLEAAATPTAEPATVEGSLTCSV